MKSELKAKFLQHLVQKKQEKGFTLIELLVVIIIIGILSAIALPSFLNQANKAKQSEAKQYVGALNRSQQAYYLENSQFGSNSTALGKPVKDATKNYQYGEDAAGTFLITGAKTPTENVVIRGTAQKAALRSYVGLVEIGQVTDTSEATTLAILCETDKPLGVGVAAARPTSASQCAPNTSSLEK